MLIGSLSATDVRTAEAHIGFKQESSGGRLLCFCYLRRRGLHRAGSLPWIHIGDSCICLPQIPTQELTHPL